MSHWDHRVLQETLPNGESWYSIREVFYNSDQSIYAYDTEPVNISGESVEELREYVQWILNCLEKPVLIASEVVFEDHSVDYPDIEDDDNEAL